MFLSFVYSVACVAVWRILQVMFSVWSPHKNKWSHNFKGLKTMLEIHGHQRGLCSTREHPHSPVHYCENKSRSLIICLTRRTGLAPRGRCSVLTLGVQCHCGHCSISCLIPSIIPCRWIELNRLNSPVNILKPELGMICLLSKKSVKVGRMNSAWKVSIPFPWPQRMSCHPDLKVSALEIAGVDIWS